MDKKKVLMVTYGFPPKGGGGVQRNVKFLKYLNKLNWKTTVLTVKDINSYVYDSTLLDELANETDIHRAGSLDPFRVSKQIRNLFKRNNTEGISKEKKSTGINEGAWFVKVFRKVRDVIFFPDALIGWVPYAYLKGKKVIESDRPDIIFGSFPSSSNAIVTYLLARKYKIPYLLDFRDGWLDDPYSPYPTFLHRKGHEYLERKILKKADLLIVYGDILKERFESRYPGISEKIEILPNGFDPEDFSNLSPVLPETDKIRLVYSGNMFGARKENFINFLDGINKLPLELRERIETVFVGSKFTGINEIIESKELTDKVSMTGYLPHMEALNYLSSGKAGIVFLPPGEITGITGKVFEYLGLGMPVLACVDKKGACSKLLNGIDADQGVCEPDNPQSIADAIVRLNKLGWKKISLDKTKHFSRKYHSQLLSEHMKNTID